MGRIKKTFDDLQAKKRKALILFITAGDPTLKITAKLIPHLFDAGADLIEIGLPFTDPLADGPIIQASYIRALKKGINATKTINMVSQVRSKTEKPIIFMSAYNLMYGYGLKKFFSRASSAGVDGIIFPDLIPDEAGSVLPLLNKGNIDPIFLAAPTSTKERLKKITSASKGFIYYISVKGITGQKKPSVNEVRKQVLAMKKITDLPIACGFGIKTPEDASKMSRITDGVVIGSALVKIIAEGKNEAEKINKAVSFVKKVRKAIDHR